MSDEEFDAIYPDWVVELSSMFWTPLEVAKRALALLECERGQRVLDIGSGCGKFCTVGAICTEADFFGVEQRADLVDVAKTLAVKHSLSQIEYLTGNMNELDWQEFNAFYLFNPFHEQTSGPWVQIDDTVSYSRETQAAYVRTVVERLADLPSGTRVTTYFGFGGTFPSSYTKLAYEHFEQGPLELWVKD